MLRITYYILLLIAVTACEKEKNNGITNFKFKTKSDTYNFNRELNSDLSVTDTIHNFPLVSFFQDNIVNKFIYASSHDKGVIYKFDKTLNVIDTISKQGPGPKEFQNPLCIKSLKDKLIFIDNGQYALKNYSKKNKLISTIKSKATFFQFSVLSENICYLSSQKNDNHKNSLEFKKASLVDNNIQDIVVNKDSYFKNQFINHAYQGEFCSNKNYAIYYPLYGGKLIIFSNNFNDVDFLKTVDNTKKAKAKRVNVGNYSVMQTNKDKYIYINARLNNQDNLYLLNSVSDSKHFYIDIYDINNKNYINSYKIPILNNQKPKDFIVIDKQLFLLYSDYTLLKCKLL